MRNKSTRHFQLEDIQAMDKVYRLNLINCVTGFKSANLIGTRNSSGVNNLATFSSVTHLGSNPPMVGFVLRPTVVPRHSYENILESGYYTINHIGRHMIQRAHYCSAKFEENQSEFEKCQLNPAFLQYFPAPFVEESPIKMGLKFEEEIEIRSNGTRLIVGRIEHMFIDKNWIDDRGMIDLDHAGTVAISGLNNYHQTERIGSYPYARVEELPEVFSDEGL
jgi:flavin reductase (DIM6/NTAB) family NADH-FMN oxidoreductase RutF